MEHHHHHDHEHDHSHEHAGPHVHPVTQNLKVAFFLNLGFTLVEFIGGLITNSVAILSDAVHDLGDTFAIGSSWFLENYAQKGRTTKYSFGYKRFSPLSALINSAILLTGSFFIVFETVPRLFQPEPVNAQGMLLLAVLGVVMNGAAVLRLRKSQDSVNQRTVMLHLMEDALGWIAVLIGSIVMYFTGWTVIDPILSLGIAVYIFVNAFKNLRAVLTIFLQATPKDVDIEKVKEDLLSIEEVQDLHDTHVWTMDGQYNILTVHLVLTQNRALSELPVIRDRVHQVLKQHHIQHITVQFEVPGEMCELEKH